MSASFREKRAKGKHPEQEKVLYKKYKARRTQGMVVDSEFLKTQMSLLVKEQKEEIFVSSNKWLHGYKKRYGVSKQKKRARKVNLLKSVYQK